MTINCCLVFKEGQYDNMVSGTLCRPQSVAGHIPSRDQTACQTPTPAFCRLQLIASLILSMFLIGTKCKVVGEIGQLQKRKAEILELIRVLEKELDEEEKAIDQWMQGLASDEQPESDAQEKTHRSSILEASNPTALILKTDSSAPKSKLDARLRIVGVRVRHSERGFGTVAAFRKDDARGKPVVVNFDCGQPHSYSWAQALKKLTPVPSPLETKSATTPISGSLAGMDDAICQEQLEPAEDRNQVHLPLPGATAVLSDHTDDAAALIWLSSLFSSVSK